MDHAKRIDRIIEEMESQGVTAYEIAQNTSLTPKGIQKIRDRITENPRTHTLDEIESYLNISTGTTSYRNDTKIVLLECEDLDILSRQVQENWEALSQRENFKGFFYCKVAQALNMKIEDIFASALNNR